jgi:hypothetical protein
VRKFVIQLLINAVAFFVAITLLRGHGIEAQGGMSGSTTWRWG